MIKTFVQMTREEREGRCDSMRGNHLNIPLQPSCASSDIAVQFNSFVEIDTTFDQLHLARKRPHTKEMELPSLVKYGSDRDVKTPSSGFMQREDGSPSLIN